MKGINPFILSLVILISLIILFTALYFLMGSSIVLLTAIILVMSAIGYSYSFIKVEVMSKGKLIYKPKSKIRKVYYDSILIILLNVLLILSYKGIIPTLLIAIIIVSDFIFCLGYYAIWKPPIKAYEKGIVLGNTAFYNWDELNINEEGDKINIKIKYIPKEIVLDKNVLEGVNYERN